MRKRASTRVPKPSPSLWRRAQIAVTAAARGLASPAEGPVGSSEPAPTCVAASLSVAALNDSPLAGPRSGTHRPVGCGARCTRSYGVTAL